jgi:hypothetical protein
VLYTIFYSCVLRGDASDAIPYLVERQKLFGLVKVRHKRHREIDAYTFFFGSALARLTSQ